MVVCVCWCLGVCIGFVLVVFVLLVIFGAMCVYWCVFVFTGCVCCICVYRCRMGVISGVGFCLCLLVVYWWCWLVLV